MIEGIVYALVLIFFTFMIYRCLNALNIDNRFKQGRLFEIKFMFIVISIVISFLLCELLDKILSFGGLSL